MLLPSVISMPRVAGDATGDTSFLVATLRFSLMLLLLSGLSAYYTRAAACTGRSLSAEKAFRWRIDSAECYTCMGLDQPQASVNGRCRVLHRRTGAQASPLPCFASIMHVVRSVSGESRLDIIRRC